MAGIMPVKALIKCKMLSEWKCKMMNSDDISDCQWLAKPLGLEGRVQRVRVRVGISVPLANPYP